MPETLRYRPRVQEDITERALHTAFDLREDFARARHEAGSLERLIQLNERVAAILEAFLEEQNEIQAAQRAWDPRNY